MSPVSALKCDCEQSNWNNRSYHRRLNRATSTRRVHALKGNCGLLWNWILWKTSLFFKAKDFVESHFCMFTRFQFVSSLASSLTGVSTRALSFQTIIWLDGECVNGGSKRQYETWSSVQTLWFATLISVHQVVLTSCFSFNFVVAGSAQLHCHPISELYWKYTAKEKGKIRI